VPFADHKRLHILPGAGDRENRSEIHHQPTNGQWDGYSKKYTPNPVLERFRNRFS
jgi:hypothetical protein